MDKLSMLKLKPYDPVELSKCKIVEDRYVCTICIEICLTLEQLKNHYVNIHKFKDINQSKKAKINETKDYFNESSEQSSESTTQNETKIKQSYFSPKICSICEMNFKNQKTL